MTPARRSEGEPHDELTRLADTVLPLLAEHDDVRAIVMVMRDAPDGGTWGGIGMTGYPASDDGDAQAMADLLTHLSAMFEANGKRLMIVPMPQAGPS